MSKETIIGNERNHHIQTSNKNGLKEYKLPSDFQSFRTMIIQCCLNNGEQKDLIPGFVHVEITHPLAFFAFSFGFSGFFDPKVL